MQNKGDAANFSRAKSLCKKVCVLFFPFFQRPIFSYLLYFEFSP